MGSCRMGRIYGVHRFFAWRENPSNGPKLIGQGDDDGGHFAVDDNFY